MIWRDLTIDTKFKPNDKVKYWQNDQKFYLGINPEWRKNNNVDQVWAYWQLLYDSKQFNTQKAFVILTIDNKWRLQVLVPEKIKLKDLV